MKETAIIAELQQKISLCEDMKAYRQLYDLLYERLFWFSWSFVKSKEAAEEIVSDVFINSTHLPVSVGPVGDIFLQQ